MDQPHVCPRYYTDGKPMTDAEWDLMCDMRKGIIPASSPLDNRYTLTNPVVNCPVCGKPIRTLTITTWEKTQTT